MIKSALGWLCDQFSAPAKVRIRAARSTPVLGCRDLPCADVGLVTKMVATKPYRYFKTFAVGQERRLICRDMLQYTPGR